jgi:hypothetical protein
MRVIEQGVDSLGGGPTFTELCVDEKDEALKGIEGSDLFELVRSSAVVEVYPRAQQTGRLDLRPESMAIRIEHDDAGTITGVIYVDAEGIQHRQKARAVGVESEMELAFASLHQL